jgi:hypothetical protein
VYSKDLAADVGAAGIAYTDSPGQPWPIIRWSRRGRAIVRGAGRGDGDGGVLLVAFRWRRMVQVNLVALLQEVGPYVLGGDERLRLLSIIRNVAPDQVVTIDLSRCAKK